MRCERCGKQIGNRYYKYNNSYLCPECAKVTGVSDALGNTFKLFDSDLMNMIPQVISNLDFSSSRTQITCPKCGTSLRDFDRTGSLGCIECYNTFNDQIMRLLMKNQGTADYLGREPGVLSDYNVDSGSKDVESVDFNVETSEETKNDDKLSRYENSDIGMLSDDDLKDAIKLAVEAENYLLAARFRDELKGREGN